MGWLLEQKIFHYKSTFLGYYLFDRCPIVALTKLTTLAESKELKYVLGGN